MTNDTRTVRPYRLARALAALALATAGCGPGEPVARLEATPAEVALPYPGTAVVDLSWVPAAPLDRPMVFVHLLDAAGAVVRTFDHPYPGEWRPGEEVSYSLTLWQSALGAPLPAGTYELTAGVYTPAGKRPPLTVEGREVDDGEYAVVRVETPPPSVGGPRLAFGDGWLPLAPDTDAQDLGIRWMGEQGALEVSGLDGPLDLALTVLVPAPGDSPHRLVLDAGATEPAVEISSPCAAEPARVAGPGIHAATLELRPAAGARACPVRFDPAFVYLDPQTLGRHSLQLRRVVWSPGPAAPEQAAGEEEAAPAESP